MKLVNIIFSMYLLFLTGLPCTDAECAVDDTTVSAGVPFDDGHDHDHEDSCPPFCSCNCCGATFAFILNNTTFVSDITVISENNPVILHEDISDFSYAIWQPPKI